ERRRGLHREEPVTASTSPTSSTTPSSHDVVVTGYGATTPLGGDAASTWDALLAGRSGVSPLEAEWVDRFNLPVKIAAQLAVEPTEVLKRVEARRLDRSEHVAVVAAREAWAHAGLAGETPV